MVAQTRTPRPGIDAAPATDRPSSAQSADPLATQIAEPIVERLAAGVLENMLSGVAYCQIVYQDGSAVDFLHLYTNPAFHRLTGLGPVTGRRISEILPEFNEADSRFMRLCARVAEGGPAETYELFVKAWGQWFSGVVYCPKPGHFVAIFDLTTAHKEVETALQASNTQLRFVLEGSELGFWDWNLATGKVERNAQWAAMLGYTYEEMQQTTQQWSDFVHPEDRDRAWTSIFDAVEGRSPAHKLEYRMLHKDGSVRWILDQAKVMERDAQGRAVRMCGTHTDVTERKLLEQELWLQARVDYLTGVSNRRHFMERAEQELHRCVRYGGQLSILMLDIDHFKLINDRYGHKVGDLVIKTLTQVCTASLRDVDVIGRMGGEEFAVLLPETDRSVAVSAAERLRVAIDQAKVPLADGLPVKFSVSIGVAAMQSADDNLDVLLNRADAALYEAKGSGRNRVCAANGQ